MTIINLDYSIKQNIQGGRTNNKNDSDKSDLKNINEKLKDLRGYLDPKKNIILADDEIFGNSGGGFPINVKGIA